MPSLDIYKKIYNVPSCAPANNGHARKAESDAITEATFTESTNYHIGYLYDYYHDGHITQLNDLKPQGDANKIPIELHFYSVTQQTLDKDYVSHHIMFRPGQECNVDYYEKVFAKRYGADFPMGLFCDLPDNKGRYNRWLIVAKANDNVVYTTYEVLRCDYVYQYIVNKKRYQVPGVARSQNSYCKNCCSLMQ